MKSLDPYKAQSGSQVQPPSSQQSLSKNHLQSQISDRRLSQMSQLSRLSQVSQRSNLDQLTPSQRASRDQDQLQPVQKLAVPISASSSCNNNSNQTNDQTSSQQKIQVSSHSDSPVPPSSLKDEFTFEVSKSKQFKQPMQRMGSNEQYPQHSQYHHHQQQQKQKQQYRLLRQNLQPEQQYQQQSHVTVEISQNPQKHPFGYSSDRDRGPGHDIVVVNDDTEPKPGLISSTPGTSTDEEDAVVWNSKASYWQTSSDSDLDGTSTDEVDAVGWSRTAASWKASSDSPADIAFERDFLSKLNSGKKKVKQKNDPETKKIGRE
ncbi:unnamed protein product, partial [Ambrosiozyma monospora]